MFSAKKGFVLTDALCSVLIVAVLACTPFFKWLQEKFERMVKNRELSAGLVFGGRTIVAIAALLLGIMVMAGSSYQPFLYNQF